MKSVTEHMERLCNPLDGSLQAREVEQQKILLKIN